MHCGAKTRSGTPCKSMGMKNARCRMHGGTSPGAPTGQRNGNYKHGYWTKAEIDLRREMSEFVREMKKALT